MKIAVKILLILILAVLVKPLFLILIALIVSKQSN